MIVGNGSREAKNRRSVGSEKWVWRLIKASELKYRKGREQEKEAQKQKSTFFSFRFVF